MKISKGWKIFIGIIVGGTVIYLSTIFYLVQKMEYEIKATRELLMKVDHQCPQGTKDVISGGGKTGATRYCEKNGIKHGKIIRWDSQRPSQEGYYNEGKAHGMWKSYHRDGRVYRVTEYNNGIETSDKILDPRASVQE